MDKYLQITKDKLLRHNSVGLNLRIRPVFDDFHRLTVQESCDYPEHRHIRYELIYADSTSYSCRLNSSILKLNKGDFLIIKPDDLHQDYFRKGHKHYVLHFSLSLTGNSAGENLKLFKEGLPPEQQCGSLFKTGNNNFFRHLEDELAIEDLYSTYTQDSLFETFFWQLIRNLPPPSLSHRFRQLSEQQNFQSRLGQLFASSQYGKLTIPDMAAALGMSERALFYRCRDSLNQSPSRAFTSYRIKKAAEYLERAEMNIKEISSLFGFENPFHFSRLFKDIMGTSPRSYLKKKLSGEDF